MNILFYQDEIKQTILIYFHTKSVCSINAQ